MAVGKGAVIVGGGWIRGIKRRSRDRRLKKVKKWKRSRPARRGEKA